MIYLDNAATSYPKPDITIKSISDFSKNQINTVKRRGYNSESPANSVIEDTRKRLLSLIGAKYNDYLVFTLNSTEAINMGLKGILEEGDHVITSTFEHSAVSRTLTALSREKKIDFTCVYPNNDGHISAATIKEHIRPNTKLIALCHGSNVLGNIIPDSTIGDLAEEKGIIYFLDASQTVGSYPIDVQKSRVDMLSISGHKSLMGPSGVGCLYFKKELKLKQYRHGGTGINSENDWIEPLSSSDYETGTPNVLGIAGLNESLKFINEVGLDNIISHKQKLINNLITELLKRPEIIIYGNTKYKERLPILSINLKGPMTCNEVGLLLEKSFEIKTRTGLHCSPWTHKYIETYPTGTLRVSFGFFNSEDDIKHLLSSLDIITNKLKAFT